MGEIHCMFTSTNKPLVSVLLVHYMKQLLFLSAIGCGFNLHPDQKVQTTLLNEQTFMAGF